MDFRLYSLLLVVASAYCIGLDAELHAKFNNCPKLSGPSVVKHLDVDNNGVERLVVYFYRARNSRLIVPFIPSKEYQNCIEDIAEEAGEAFYNNSSGVTVEGLFERSLDRTIRYRIKHSAIRTESPLDIWPQPWNKGNIQQGSHEYDNTDYTGYNAVDYPEHDYSLPNDVPVIHDIDDDKKPDWHIPVEEPDIHELPGWPDRSTPRPDNDSREPNNLPREQDSSVSYQYPDKNISIEEPVVSPHDRERPQDFDINVIEPIRPDDNWQLITSEDNEAPVIRDPDNPDELQPIVRENIKAPVIRPFKNLIIEPNRYGHKSRPVIREEIEAPEDRALENPIFEPNHNDKLRPIKSGEIEAPEIIPLDNHIAANGPHHNIQPIINEDIESPVIRPLENDIIAPIYPNNLQPIIRENIGVPVIRPLENILIEPNNHDLRLRPIIREEFESPIIRPLENYIAPNHPQHNIQPNIRKYLKVPVTRQKESPFPDLSYSDEIRYQLNSGEDNDIISSRDNDYRDLKRKINGGLNINNENINSFVIPTEDHEYSTTEHGDSDESLNSQNKDSQELNAHSQRRPLNEPSEEDTENSRDHLNLVYKWHKVKVPRVDSNGKVYGWIWKSVRSPVRSKSVKWSYWESSGKRHRLTHWKHKSSSSSSSSKLYHQSLNDDISMANFDGWLKKQIKKMQNNGNHMPSSDDDIYTVRVAIEKTLKTNGIRVKSGGILIDAEGKVLRLDNIKLRPIYIGQSLAYGRILKNSDKSTKYKIPANTPFLEGLLVALINPSRTLGIVPLGITSLPRVNSNEGNIFLGSGRELHPISIQNGLHKLLSGHLSEDGQISSRLRPKVLVKDDSKSLSEEEPEYRIIGGSFAVGSGTPLANRGRSGKD